jgi:hypothetical protein
MKVLCAVFLYLQFTIVPTVYIFLMLYIIYFCTVSIFTLFTGSEDEAVQEASADCLQNIRKLALACEKFRYQHMKA